MRPQAARTWNGSQTKRSFKFVRWGFLNSKLQNMLSGRYKSKSGTRENRVALTVDCYRARVMWNPWYQKIREGLGYGISIVWKEMEVRGAQYRTQNIEESALTSFGVGPFFVQESHKCVSCVQWKTQNFGYSIATIA